MDPSGADSGGETGVRDYPPIVPGWEFVGAQGEVLDAIVDGQRIILLCKNEEGPDDRITLLALDFTGELLIEQDLSSEQLPLSDPDFRRIRPDGDDGFFLAGTADHPDLETMPLNYSISLDAGLSHAYSVPIVIDGEQTIEARAALVVDGAHYVAGDVQQGAAFLNRYSVSRELEWSILLPDPGVEQWLKVIEVLNYGDELLLWVEHSNFGWGAQAPRLERFSKVDGSSMGVLDAAEIGNHPPYRSEAAVIRQIHPLTSWSGGNDYLLGGTFWGSDGDDSIPSAYAGELGASTPYTGEVIVDNSRLDGIARTALGDWRLMKWPEDEPEPIMMVPHELEPMFYSLETQGIEGRLLTVGQQVLVYGKRGYGSPGIETEQYAALFVEPSR